MLDRNFSKYGYPVNTTVISDPEKIPPQRRQMLGIKYTVDNSKSKELLNMEYNRSVEDSLVETVKSLALNGIIENKITE